MLKGISKLLNGDLLKALCDMGHSDELVIVDGNYPARSMNDKVIEYNGVDSSTLCKEILNYFPLDTYSNPVFVMDTEEVDKDKKPEAWDDFEKITGVNLVKLDRHIFYERSKKASLIIQTGDQRAYANIILVKGVVE